MGAVFLMIDEKSVGWPKIKEVKKKIETAWTFKSVPKLKKGEEKTEEDKVHPYPYCDWYRVISTHTRTPQSFWSTMPSNKRKKNKEDKKAADDGHK